MYLESSSPRSISAAASEMNLAPDSVLMVLIAEEQRPALGEVVAALLPLGIRFFGGVFPGLIHGQHGLTEGVILASFPAAAPPVVVSGLDRSHPTLPTLGTIASQPPGSQTALILVDGLTSNVSRLLSELHNRLGNSVDYIGGGAGILSLEREPCVFSNNGVFQDAAVIAFVAQSCSLGVRHGWKRLGGPLVATRTDGNVIHELNWDTPFDVYRSAIQSFDGTELNADNFFVASTVYPFGIYKEGSEDVVRDPIAVGAAGELICVGEVPENAVLNILKGDHASLVDAAAHAANDCCKPEVQNAGSALVVDCVSRALFLQDDFAEELSVVRTRLHDLDPQLAIQGMLTLGEISSHESGVVEFFNKTIVTGVLYD